MNLYEVYLRPDQATALYQTYMVECVTVQLWAFDSESARAKVASIFPHLKIIGAEIKA